MNNNYYKYNKYKSRYIDRFGGSDSDTTNIPDVIKTVSLAPPNNHIELRIGYKNNDNQWYILGSDDIVTTPIEGSFPMIKDDNGTELEYKHGSQVFIVSYIDDKTGSRRLRFMS